ncbi:AAA family ATPase [Sneathiella sp. HT1-7]|uniref:AAA family ATPase n=1 Tax=Sneathiella sp. HT1-7 TaxID=2887192 RepID=UPI001D136B6D|nr:AAA family ATPase [Sneathiella sp. HT1-7]MCC3305776.1 AAA family ATPase [Sneathiella sp. HT1-7]
MPARNTPEIVTFPNADGANTSVAAYVADRETEKQLNDLLPKWGYDKAQIKRGSLSDVIRDYSEKNMPTVLIVDISKVALPLSDLQNLADICPPRVKVVVLGTEDNVGLYRDLMEIGVTDYLVKPVPSDLLFRAVARASGRLAARNPEPRAGKSVAVFGVRGGVGATTAVLNLGWLLANHYNRHVMLADLNLTSGTLALEMGVEPASGLADLLTGPDRIDNVFVDRATREVEERLKLLASETDFAAAPVYNADAVAQLVQHLRSRYHFIIQDVDRASIETAMTVLQNADVRVLVMDSTLASVRDAARIFKVLKTEGEEKKSLLVLNRSRARIRGDVPLEKICRFVDHPIDIVIPFEKKKLALASLNAEPVVRQKLPITDAYHRLAAELIGRKAKARRLGWFAGRKGA